MINSITTFNTTTISGTTMIGELLVLLTITELTISGTVQFESTPEQYLTITLNKQTGKSSVSFSATDPSAILPVITPLTEKLEEIKNELAG